MPNPNGDRSGKPAAKKTAKKKTAKKR